jgi:hypothetical protein
MKGSSLQKEKANLLQRVFLELATSLWLVQSCKLNLPLEKDPTLQNFIRL